MRIRRLSLAVLAGALFLIAASSGATVTDGTFWFCSSHETLKVTGSPKSQDDFSGVTLDFDQVGGVLVYLPDPNEVYGGLTTAIGATGFLITPDQTAMADLKSYVSDRVQAITGADSVDITSFTFRIKGKVKDGVFSAVLKAKGKGSISVGGRTRKGSGKLTEVLSASPK